MKVNTIKQLCQACLVGVCLWSSLAYANTPSPNTVNRLGELVPYEEVLLGELLAPLNQERQVLAYNLSNDNKLTDAQRQNALKIFDDYANNMIKTIQTPAVQSELKQAFLTAAKTHYTQAEVDAQIAFYGSSAGKSAIDKQPQVFGVYLQSVAPKAIKLIEEYQRNHATKTQERINQIINPSAKTN